MQTAQYALSDAGNAEVFAALYGETYRYLNSRQEWYAWNAPDSSHGFWSLDSDLTRNECAVKAARTRHHNLVDDPPKSDSRAAFAWCLKSESRERINACVELAQLQSPISVKFSECPQWDADPYLLGFPNGVLHLPSGTFFPPDPTVKISLPLHFDYSPDAECPEWMKFLSEVQPDAGMVDFLQECWGLTISGSTAEQKMFFVFGKGANGKGTMLEVFERNLAPLAANLNFDSVAHGGPQRSTRGDIFKLQNKRYARVSETEEGRYLNTGRLKAISHGDVITASDLFIKETSFQITCKLWMEGNCKPKITDDSEGFWRSLILIEFNQYFPPESWDTNLPAKLDAEFPGILNWAVRGFQRWNERGFLAIPATVKGASSTYREEENPLLEFITDLCYLDPDVKIQVPILYKAYTEYESGEGRNVATKILDSRSFGHKMANIQGVRAGGKSNGIRFYRGISLLSERTNSLL